jgi:hypothetical protein
MTTRPTGPAWLGIGAQRCGTTWLTKLITQHPRLDVGRVGRKGSLTRVKEHRFLHRLAEGMADEADYLSRFDEGSDVLLGEWTPLYMATLNVPNLAARLCQPDAPFFAVVRDPIDRYVSGMDLWLNPPQLRRQARKGNPAERWQASSALPKHVWHGMYADQLDAWRRVVGRERLVVMTYESAREDPDTACKVMWSSLGLDPIDLEHLDNRKKPEGKRVWSWPEGLRDHLLHLYTPQVQRLRDDWGIDVSQWQNFASRV